MATRKFHHGNLRAELIDLAKAELSEHAPDEISLRDLALRLGVSTAAPYRHFNSKDDLLQAVAQSGLADMVAIYRSAAVADTSPRDRLRIGCRAYLDLATANPGLFDLLFFTRDFAWSHDPPGERPASAFAIFEGLVADVHPGADPKASRLHAIAAWSMLHGFAILRARGRIERIADIDAAEEEVLRRACGG